MDEDILLIVSDMEEFVAEHWTDFKDRMEEKGFFGSEVDEMRKKLEQFLAENGHR